MANTVFGLVSMRETAAVAFREPESNEAGHCVAEMKVAQQELAELLDGIFDDLEQLCAAIARRTAKANEPSQYF